MEDAVRSGAAAVLVTKWQDGLSVLQAQTTDNRKALAALANRFYGYPSREMKMIGITATNGKTTTTNMLHRIFRANGEKAGLLGSVQ